EGGADTHGGVVRAAALAAGGRAAEVGAAAVAAETHPGVHDDAGGDLRDVDQGSAACSPSRHARAARYSQLACGSDGATAGAGDMATGVVPGLRHPAVGEEAARAPARGDERAEGGPAAVPRVDVDRRSGTAGP